MPGPAPKHPSQRLGHRAGGGEQWRQLPRSGRGEPAPAWPLELVPDDAEARRWDRLWSMPQAVVWAEQRAECLVARYVLHLIAVETRDPSTRLLAEVRQMEAQLLLAPGSLAKARMEIAADEVAERRNDRPAVSDEVARRRRLMAVDDAVARA